MVVVSLLPQFQETCRSKSETAETNDALPPPLTRCRVALARGREALAAREGAGREGAAREGAGQGYLQQPHTLGSLRQGSQCDICEGVLRLQGDSASSSFLYSLE